MKPKNETKPKEPVIHEAELTEEELEKIIAGGTGPIQNRIFGDE